MYSKTSTLVGDWMLLVRESELLDCKLEYSPTLLEFHLIMLYSVLFVITFIIYSQHLQRHRMSGAPAMGLHPLHQAQQPADPDRAGGLSPKETNG